MSDAVRCCVELAYRSGEEDEVVDVCPPYGLFAAQNTSLQGQLETLRADTLESFTRARGLQDEWAAVDAAQREAYKVSGPASGGRRRKLQRGDPRIL